MGITISYMGSLADPSRADEMVREVRAFATHMGWRTWTVPELMELGEIEVEGLRGITVSVAQGCDPVHLHVDSEGRLVNYTYYGLLHDPKKRRWFFGAIRANNAALRGEAEPITYEELERLSESEEEDDPEPQLRFAQQGLGYNWTKTQFGGPAAHVQVCTLLRFVREHFAPDLEVQDETGYFEHGRLDDVKSEMALVEQSMRQLTGAVARAREEGGASSVDELLAKLVQYMNEARARN